MERLLKLRADIYNFLRVVFLKGPDTDLVEGLRNTSLFDESDINGKSDLNKGIKILLSSIKRNELNRRKLLEDLNWDYHRLFVGPYKLLAPPYESAYRNDSHLVMQEETIAVREVYQTAGLRVKNLHTFPDDHIGIELELMYYLTKENYKALLEKKREKALQFLNLQKKFLDEHLSRWIPLFSGDIINNAKTGFYKGIAILTRGYIEEETININDLISQSLKET
jgi:TorA maturation chaperone TorD